ncbi:hypothetical protein PTKIN_Ptkin01aG0004900 [Pterospermum kingtungense]
MKVRLLLDVPLLLARYKMIKKWDGSLFKVTFKYERLTIFCFICGLLGHSKRFCPKHLDGDSSEVQATIPVTGGGGEGATSSCSVQ